MKPIPYIQRIAPLDYVQARSDTVTTISGKPVGELSMAPRVIALAPSLAMNITLGAVPQQGYSQSPHFSCSRPESHFQTSLA
jgi:hypothetical protein